MSPSRFDDSTVRVILLQSWPRDRQLEFVLIFPDHYEKHIALHEYDIRAYGAASERTIIEDHAAQYLAENGQPTDNIHLIFM